MNRQERLSIAYIISMKNGIHSFIHREMLELEKRGMNISIFPTKYGKGLYYPHPSWKIRGYNSVLTALKQPLYFIKSPRKYMVLLRQAIATRSIIDFAIACEFSERMREDGIERIHCHFGDHKLFVGYYCKLFLDLPLTVTIHAYELYSNPNWDMFRKALAFCDKVITVSEYNKKILVKKFGSNPSKVATIPLFADVDGDVDSHPKELEEGGNGTINILIVGRFVEKKGHDILFRAIKNLKRDDVKLLVIGSGPLDLPALAKQLGIEDKVRFLGNLSDASLRRYYMLCDLFCLPSRTVSNRHGRVSDQEGIPVSLIEAMAYGKPVVSTRHSGIPELVEEILVEENNVEELTEAIRRLLDDPKLRVELGKRNRRIIEERFSKKNVDKLVEIFQEVRR